MKNYVHIATFTYPSELTIAKSSLEANNINCYVRDELTIQVHNFLSNAIGGIRLEVEQHHYEKAKYILINSGFEDFICDENSFSIEISRRKNISKILKVSIQVVLVICLFWILLILYFLLTTG